MTTPGSESGAISKQSAKSVADTVSRLLDLLAAKGMTVFAVIDQRAAALEVGLTLRETSLVLFGSPTAGTPVMDAVPLSALDLPLKILVWSDNEGRCQVTYTDPAVLAARYGLDDALSARLAGITGITDALVAP
jgi:uncharacterized protein (DUF302 family)